MITNRLLLGEGDQIVMMRGREIPLKPFKMVPLDWQIANLPMLNHGLFLLGIDFKGGDRHRCFKAFLLNKPSQNSSSGTFLESFLS